MADTGGFQTFWLWGAGIVILGLILAFAALRAGSLRPGERARIDRNTEAAMRAHDEAERNAPAGNDLPVRANRTYAILIPVAAMALVIVLMIWSLADIHGPSDPSREAAKSQQTTGSAAPKSSQPAAAAPRAPNNDAASDSARSDKAPLNKSH